jgi:hypothetical protein
MDQFHRRAIVLPLAKLNWLLFVLALPNSSKPTTRYFINRKSTAGFPIQAKLIGIPLFFFVMC